jgi:hypothetical protein
LSQIASLGHHLESEKCSSASIDRTRCKSFPSDTTRRNVAEHRASRRTGDLIEIKTQTQKTNGRVTALEHKDLKRAGWYAGASFIVAAIFQFAIHFLKV